jgi:hypothetical protein
VPISFLKVAMPGSKVAAGFTATCLVYDGKTAVVSINAAAMIIFFMIVYFLNALLLIL